ncbi:MAG: class I SAM-dependent methyltransferase, partial [Merismopedia sp. SIO2A8]|nr:class I SAM-dependent methyltransferase [Merismopedia sp. SIO2A8]
QQWLTQDMALPGQGLHWCTWEEIASDSVVGCFLSNELVDAFPVHLLRWDQGQLWERYVTTVNADDGTIQFQEVVGELSTDVLLEYFELVGIEWSSDRYESGYCTEVNLAALDWLTTVASRLHQGYVLTIDYGYPAHRYYNPARNGGTLQCYYQHAHHSDPYLHVGNQDITSHVDFTALERHGERCGLTTVGFMQQALFLMALGLGDRIAALSSSAPSSPIEPNETLAINDILRRREALHALMNPIGMGNFGVLVQSKGLSSEQQATPLKGLDIPTMG